MDLQLRDKEYKYPSFQFYDAGIKEGKFGFYCHDCQGLNIASLHFYAQQC